MFTLKVCSRFPSHMIHIVLTLSAELDDDDDPHPVTEPPETTAPATESTSLDPPHESTPIKVETERSA